jgi:adenosine deaminase
MSLYAELHRHLGGAVVPRVFWRYLLRNNHPLAAEFPEYESFEAFVTRPRTSLAEYLELHALVEPFQTLETLPYFVSKLVRGAYVFEGICYLELRHTPYYRTDPALSEADRIAQMRDVVVTVGESGHDPRYPLLMRQILCMHSRLPYAVNKAILDLAFAMPQYVCGVDLAGPDIYYAERLDEWVGLFRSAREGGMKTTGHLYETPDGCHPSLLPYLSRIGHGIQIALRFPELLPEVAARGQCLEVCPTTYLKTGTLQDLTTLRTVFERCEAAGVDVAICTDNAGLHNVRLPWEYENLLTQDVIDFSQLAACQDAAFRHAFAWPHPHPPRVLLDQLIQPSPPIAAGGPKGEPI